MTTARRSSDAFKAADERYNLTGFGVTAAAVPGEKTGPLSDLTIGLKANIAVAGHVQSAGMAHRHDHVAVHHANVTDRLLQSGAAYRWPCRLDLSRTPSSLVSSVPDAGEHTDAILNDLGLDADRVADLRSRGVI